MHLKSLELTGFKSFAEGKIDFPQGVTAVVGPNGSGKSNVVDAILWVLGEQSTKTLRSERMEDVIFNGTEARKPLGMVEVSLVMSGVSDEQWQGLSSLPVQLGDGHDVMVTRRLYRNGDSEYLINKTQCRLKDVRSLFLDTRAGSKGHTVIEQGRIEQILNASPQDRRELIEETAGIVRYKKQKAEALRKLDSTHQSLLRVRDIIAEVQRQLTSLERQARQARAYQNLQQEARTLEIRLLVTDYRARLAAQEAVIAEVGGLETEESAHLAEQGRLQAELEAVKLQVTEAEQTLARVREEADRLERLKGQAVTATEVERAKLEQFEQQRVQAQVDLARCVEDGARAAETMQALRLQLDAMEAEIAVAAQGLADLEAEAAAAATRRAAAVAEEERARRASMDGMVQVTREENGLAEGQRRLDETIRRTERLTQEQLEMEGRCRGAEERLAETVRAREREQGELQARQQARDEAVQSVARLDAVLRDLDQRIGRDQEELAATRSRLRALLGVIKEEMGYGREGEETTSLRAVCRELKQALAEWLVVPAGLDRAVEAALGERVRGWLVDGPASAKEAVALLKQKGFGRGTFVPVSPRWAAAGSAAESAWWPTIQGRPGVLGRATDLLGASGEAQSALASLFDSVVIVQSLDIAMELWEAGHWSAPAGPTLVTVDGEVLEPSGIVTGGSGAGEAAGMLQRRRETQELEGKTQELTAAVDAQRGRREEVLVERQAAQATADHLQEVIRDTDLRVLALAKDEANLSSSLADLQRRLETITTERQAEESARGDIEASIETARERLIQLTQDHRLREAELADLSQARQALDAESQTLQQRMMEARLDLAARRSQLEHGRADLVRSVAADEERQARGRELEAQLTALGEGMARSRAERERNEELCRDLTGQVDRVRDLLVQTQETLAQEGQRARDLDTALEAERAALTACRETRMGVEVRRAEIKAHLGQLEGTLLETYQLSIEAALALEPEADPSLELPEPGDGESGAESPGLRERLHKIRTRIERMGAINLAAIEEHRELEERHKFLAAQEEDLAQSISALKEIISRINRTTKQMFLDTFNELQQKFGEVFGRFFPGGRAELILTEPEAGAEGESGGGHAEPGVDIAAQPPGKRLKSITMLSGGEKTLTAMALIFASFLIRPTPFCILDEIDAPLDEENIGRFTTVLRELSLGAQFLVITHNKRTMAIADSLFGVTMEEPGVSKLVSVRLADLQPA